MTAVAQEMICEGCAEVILEPFAPSGMQFQYRAAHPLIQLMELDVLPHVLAMNYLFAVYKANFGGTSFVYGAYPGVEFLEQDSDRVIAECDVLLIFSDGSLGVGECKSRAGGLTLEEVAKLQAIRHRLNAAFTFVATLDSASECQPIWRESRADGIFALTAEHLFDLSPFNALAGPNPLDWRESFSGGPREDLSLPEHREEFRKRIERSAEDWRVWTRAPWRVEELD
jgi:hypothetical protein